MSTPQYFIDEVVADRDWRMRELEFIKKLDKKVLYNQLGEGELKVYYRMCIPTVYAHWEGFISTSFKNLIEIVIKMRSNQRNICIFTKEEFSNTCWQTKF